jgi:hypothetical protein
VDEGFGMATGWNEGNQVVGTGTKWDGIQEVVCCSEIVGVREEADLPGMDSRAADARFRRFTTTFCARLAIRWIKINEGIHFVHKEYGFTYIPS